MVDVEGVRQELADAGATARLVHLVVVASGEEEGIGFGAAGPVRAKKSAYIVPEFFWQGAEPGALWERRERQVHDCIGSPFAAHPVPAVGTSDAPEQRERPRDAAEGARQFGGGWEFAGGRETPALADEVHQEVDQLVVAGDESMSSVGSKGASGGRDPGRSEALFVVRVAEHVEDAGRGCDRAPAENPFDPRAELLLREELLEGAPGRDDAVAWKSTAASVASQSRRADTMRTCRVSAHAAARTTIRSCGSSMTFTT